MIHDKQIAQELLPGFMMPRGLEKLEKRKGRKRLLNPTQIDCDDYFAGRISRSLSRTLVEGRRPKDYHQCREKFVLYENKVAFDKEEFSSCKVRLEAKHTIAKISSMKPPLPSATFGEEEAVREFEEEKRGTTARVAKAEKIRLMEEEKREKHKREQLTKIEYDKGVCMGEDMSEKAIMKRAHRDKLLQMMHSNPQVFKVKTIQQIINKIKKDTSMEEGIPEALKLKQPDKNYNSSDYCRSIATEVTI